MIVFIHCGNIFGAETVELVGIPPRPDRGLVFEKMI